MQQIYTSVMVKPGSYIVQCVVGTFDILKFSSTGLCESCHQLNKSVLMKVVRVLESHEVQKIELAQRVREMLSDSNLPRPGDEDVKITHRPFMTRYLLYNNILLLSLHNFLLLYVY